MIPKVKNVLSVYSNATAENMRAGLTWYMDAHDFTKTIDSENPERAAGIVAALSPLNGWENNKNKTIQLYRQNGRVSISENGGNGIGLGKNVIKAQRIYFGEDPNTVLSGDKVTAFFRTIANPLGDIEPVIDRHAFDIAVGEKTDDNSRGSLSRKGVYSQFASVYREAAQIAGIGSAQMQAITWVAWRDMHGVIA